MPEIPELPLQYLDDVAYWADKIIKKEEAEKPKPKKVHSLAPTEKARKILDKTAGIAAYADDAAMLGSRLLKKQNPLKDNNSQQKPKEIYPKLTMGPEKLASTSYQESKHFTPEDMKDFLGVSAAIRNKKGDKVLLHYSPKFDTMKIMGEKGNPGELPEDILRRGMKEEFGITPLEYSKIIQQKIKTVRNGIPVNTDIYLYDVSKFKGRIKNMEPQKHQNLTWMPIEEARKIPHKTDDMRLWKESLGEYAPGIPSRGNRELPRISEPQAMMLNIQKHQAKKAGLHYDVRIVDQKTGKAYSWAVRNLPSNPGDKVLAILQPTHTASYSTWSGIIPEGYGAGTVDLFSQDKVEVTKAEPQKISFNVYKSNGDTERYVMINTGGDDWLFHNVTATRQIRPYLPAEKPHYKSISPDTLDPNKPNEVWAPKVDGALNVFHLRPDKIIETFSYRPSAKGVNKLIDHTFRMGLHRTTVPTAFRGSTVVLGEAFARDRRTDKVLSSSDTASRLLSNVWKSRELQEYAPLDNIVFNVLRYNGRDVSRKPYAEKLRLLKQITTAIPQLKMPPLAYTAQDKQDLMKQVKAGTHPLTEEGVVVYKLNEDTPLKAKLQQDYDVFIRGVFPGEGRLKGKSAGGFTYSFKPRGPIIGRVGTGLSDQMRKELWESPKNFTGSSARIFAQQQLPSGALRMPVFHDLRSEKFPK